MDLARGVELLMAIAAVFGMNQPSGMESSPALAFWAVFVAGLLLGLMANGWVQGSDAPERTLQRAKKR